MTPAEIKKAGEQLAKRSRAAQILPAKVRDKATARRVALLLVRSRP